MREKMKILNDRKGSSAESLSEISRPAASRGKAAGRSRSTPPAQNDRTLLSRFQFIERAYGKRRNQNTDTNIQIIAVSQSHRDQKYTEDNDCDLRKHMVTPVRFEGRLRVSGGNYTAILTTGGFRPQSSRTNLLLAYACSRPQPAATTLVSWYA